MLANRSRSFSVVGVVFDENSAGVRPAIRYSSTFLQFVRFEGYRCPSCSEVLVDEDASVRVMSVVVACQRTSGAVYAVTQSLCGEMYDDGTGTPLTGCSPTEAMTVLEVGGFQERVETHVLVDDDQNFLFDVPPLTSSRSPRMAGWTAWSTAPKRLPVPPGSEPSSPASESAHPWLPVAVHNGRLQLFDNKN